MTFGLTRNLSIIAANDGDYGRDNGPYYFIATALCFTQDFSCAFPFPAYLDAVFVDFVLLLPTVKASHTG